MPGVDNLNEKREAVASSFTLQALDRMLSSRLNSIENLLEQAKVAPVQQGNHLGPLFTEMLHLVQVCPQEFFTNSTECPLWCLAKSLSITFLMEVKAVMICKEGDSEFLPLSESPAKCAIASRLSHVQRGGASLS